MTTNIEIERAICRRSTTYPDQARADIRTMQAEIDRLRGAVADEYALRTAAEESHGRLLVSATAAKVQVLKLSKIVVRQADENAELCELVKNLRVTLVEAEKGSHANPARHRAGAA